MRVRYKSIWSTVMLGLSFLAIGVGAAGLILTGKFMIGTWLPGIVCLIVGLGYRNRPYFELLEDKISVPATIGPLVKTYPFTDISDLEIRDNRIWLAGEKTGISRSMAHADDWAALTRRLEAAEAFD